MKKIISIVLAVLLLVFMVLPAAASETARASGDCGEGMTWSLSDDGTLTVSGSGEMAEGSPWEDYRSDIKKVVLTGGVTKVGDNAFADCDSLTSVDFGGSLKEIGVKAFQSCDALTSIHLPATFRKFEQEAFLDCAKLKTIYCDGPMPSFRANCLWNGNNITIYYPVDNPWPQTAIDELVTNFGGRLNILKAGSDGEEIPAPKTTESTQPATEATTEPTTAPTTEPTTEPTTAPTTEPTTAPTTAPTTEPTTAPTTAPTTVPTETAEPTLVEQVGGNGWIGVVLVVAVLTVLLVGALMVRGMRHKGGKYSA